MKSEGLEINRFKFYPLLTGLPKTYPPDIENYPLVPKINETPVGHHFHKPLISASTLTSHRLEFWLALAVFLSALGQRFSSRKLSKNIFDF